MERLTKKELCSYTNMDFHSIEMDWHSIYNKLAEFEDLLEDLGVDSVEELKDHLSICGIEDDERFINEDDIWKLRLYRIAKNKGRIARQENQALKERWEKLKEFVNTRLNDYHFEGHIVSPETQELNIILNKMQELEKED